MELVVNDSDLGAARVAPWAPTPTMIRKMHITVPSNLAPQDKRKSLTPLVLHLSSDRILMGMCVNGKAEILKNQFGENSTPFVVGINHEGDLLYGSSAVAKLNSQSQEDSNCKTNSSSLDIRNHWWVRSKFIMSAGEVWSEWVGLPGGESHLITVEFLFGFILRKLKEHVEAEMNGKCSTVLIAVPIGFSSAARIQVQDSCKIAGFKRAFLVNESSAAALTCAKSKSEFLFLLSENLDNIDATVYYFSNFKGQKKLTMIGHSGKVCPEEEKSVLDYVPILNWFSEYWRDDEGSIRKICNEAFISAEESRNHTAGYFFKPREVFLLSQSERWSPLFAKVGKEFVEEHSIIDEFKTVIGAVMLGQQPKDIPEKVKDCLAHDISMSCSGKLVDTALSRGDPLPGNEKTAVTFCLPFGVREATFFQKSLDCSVNIGSLTVNNLRSNQQVKIRLEMSHEAILKIKGVSVSEKSDKNADYFSFNDYSWTTPNLLEDDLVRLTSLLDFVWEKEQERSELLNGKLELLDLCTDIKVRVKQGKVYGIQSDITRKIFMEKIDEAIDVAESASSTHEQIQTRLGSLMKWSSKPK